MHAARRHNQGLVGCVGLSVTCMIRPSLTMATPTRCAPSRLVRRRRSLAPTSLLTEASAANSSELGTGRVSLHPRAAHAGVTASEPDGKSSRVNPPNAPGGICVTTHPGRGGRRPPIHSSPERWPGVVPYDELMQAVMTAPRAPELAW